MQWPWFFADCSRLPISIGFWHWLSCPNPGFYSAKWSEKGLRQSVLAQTPIFSPAASNCQKAGKSKRAAKTNNQRSAEKTMSDDQETKPAETPKVEEEPKKEEDKVKEEESTATFEPVVSKQA